MNITILYRTLRLVLLLAGQLLVLNHVHLFGYSTPLIIVGLTMKFHRGSSRIALLLWGFVMGMLYDMFSNTTGLGMATCTLLAMLQPTLLDLFTPHDSPDDLRPSIKNMGATNYILYLFTTLLIFHFVFYALDAFTISNWLLTLTGVGIGTLISTVVLILTDLMAHPKRVES